MIALDDGVPAWWGRLADDYRIRIKQAAQTQRLDDDGRRALADSGCPMTPTAIGHGHGHDNGLELAYQWPESLREYVLLQASWDGEP